LMKASVITATIPSERPTCTRSPRLAAVDGPLGEQAERVDRDQHHVRRDLGDLELLREPLAGVDRPFADQGPDRELATDQHRSRRRMRVPFRRRSVGAEPEQARVGVRASWHRLRCALRSSAGSADETDGHLGVVVEGCRRGGGPLDRLRVPRIVARADRPVIVAAQRLGDEARRRPAP
jgi:hypothetical protein